MVNVFVPAHITGFFSIFDNEDLLKKGSLGVGVLLNKGVITNISQVYDNDDSLNLYFSNKLAILINGKQDILNQNIVLKIFELMLNDLSEFRIKFDEYLTSNSYILISQNIEVPIGCGFGTSAASAIGTAICINEFFDLNLSINQCGKYAHLAEVLFGSGLGDVIAELSNGIVKRIQPGAPGIGDVENIVSEEELFVLTKTFDSINTSSIIEDPFHKQSITNIGVNLGLEFDNDPSPENFMKLSFEFANKTNLITKDILDISNMLKDKSLGVSMAMLGNTAFALLTVNQKENICNNKFMKDFNLYKIETRGIKIW